MSARNKVLCLAGVGIGLVGIVCLGTSMVSAAFSLSHFSEFAGRAASMAAWAGVGVALLTLGGILIGPRQLRLARRILRDDLGGSLCVAVATPGSEMGNASVSGDQSLIMATASDDAVPSLQTEGVFQRS